MLTGFMLSSLPLCTICYAYITLHFFPTWHCIFILQNSKCFSGEKHPALVVAEEQNISPVHKKNSATAAAGQQKFAPKPSKRRCSKAEPENGHPRTLIIQV